MSAALVRVSARFARVGRVRVGVACVGILSIVWVRVGPLPNGLLASDNVQSTVIVDRNGETLYEARGVDGSRSKWLAASELPQALVDATVAAEDRRFFHHAGVDPIAIARAVAHNLRRRRVLEGGSTITQQVAKLLLARGANAGGQAPYRGIAAKVREAVVALRLEHRLSKREILALYLNLAPYGNQLTGAGRASQAYFGQPASLLTAAQAAFLAALPQRPSTFNPYRDLGRARGRQQRIVRDMGARGLLTPEQTRDALQERLVLAKEPAAFVAPHFVARVLAEAGEDRPRRIQTTLDAGLQRDVEGIIRAERPGLERHGAHNVAAVVLDNATGEWLAWEGSGDYGDDAHGGAIDGVVTPRQPGSALKPFTYALAFESGASPATVLADVASYFPTAQDGVLYAPRNYDGRYRGPLRARTALALSENVPAVQLASRVGVPNLLRFLRTAGFSTFDRTAAYYGLGVTLGDAEVRLDELVAAYAAFARGGVAVQPVMYRFPVPGSRFSVRGSRFGVHGSSAENPKNPKNPEPRTGNREPGTRSLVCARTAFWITDILSDDDARADTFGRGGSLEFPFPVAAKTGTSSAYHDNWAIGYTRDVTVGVWVGNFDRRPLVGSSGVTGAGPIFHAIMLAAMRRATGGLPAMDATATGAPADRTERRAVCALSGMAATPSCPSVVDEWLPADAAVDACNWHRETPRGVVIDWPAEYQAWAASARLLGPIVPLTATPRAAPHSPRAKSAPRQAAFRVLSPPDGAVYLLDPTLRREFQTISLRAASGHARVEWSVDGAPVGASGNAAIEWPLAVGRHVVAVTDGSGRQAEATIVVK